MTAPTTASLVPHSTVSTDGAPIGYHSLGTGPGVVLVHGSMQSAVSQLELAQLLAGRRAVHLVDRRGRGRSGTYPATTGVTDVEVADLLSVLRATGSEHVFGVSSGALIAARAAIATPEISRAVLFEPPLVVAESLSLGFLERFEKDLAGGDLASAMVTAMRGAQMGPAFFAAVPRPLLRTMTKRMLAADDRKTLPTGGVHLRQIAPLLRFDFAVVTEQAGRVAEFGALNSDVLLLHGGRTRPYLKTAAAELELVLPRVTGVELPGLNHGATQNKAEWGKPAAVAAVVEPFLDQTA